MNDLHDARARLGAARRWGNTDDEADARRDLAEVRLRRAVAEALAANPPISPDALASVAALLTGGAK